ncbi:MAG TPA: FIST N-terminal domain-containing protein [Candidatus Nanopelagicales bacterium]|nr:FIST N-terminal domain-containing protein [Candidatus Nanopelagicales bacterium]
MIKAASVSSVHEGSLEAGKIAAEELLAELGGQPDVVLAFVSARYDQAQVVEGLYRKLDARTRLVGCSSFAEINDEEGLSGSVAVMGMRLGGVAHESFLVRELGGREREGGRDLGAAAKAFGPNLLILLADGLVNTDQLLLGIQDELGPTFPIVGGMAIDEAKFERAFQIRDREVISGGAVALALRGQVELLSGAKSGWAPIGAARRCTKVEDGNVVLEIDGRPALSLYQDYLGPRAQEMPGVSTEFPIGIVGGLAGTQRMQDDEAILLLRSVKAVDESRQALIFGGDIPEGAIVRMTRATRADVIRGANELGEKLSASMPEPSLALFFNCGGRKMVLGPRYNEELKETFARLRGVPKIGFYSAGEFSPVGGVTMHHDETFTMALIKG